MKNLIAFFARQGVFADLLTLFVIILGIGSLFLIRREVFPNVAYDVVTIGTVFPGASPSEVEKFVTNPIEQELKEVDGIKKVTSISAESRSQITIQLDPDQTTADEGKTDIKDVVDRIKPDLPEDIEEPVITLVESKLQPIIRVSVRGDVSDFEIRDAAKFLEEEIEDLSEVGRVDKDGFRDLEFRVEADPEKLRRYRVSFEDIINALKAQNLSIPGGSIEATTVSVQTQDKLVRTIGDFEEVEDVEKTVVRANDLGRSILVTDVATVTKSLERATIINRTNGYRSINLTVLSKEGADSINLVDHVKKRVDETLPKMNPNIGVTYIDDVSFYIRRRINILSNNLLVGLSLVLIILTLLLPFRVALVVAVGIPFAFLGTIMWLHYNDMGINLISLMGLIIVLGMLVDDAIVVTENSTRHIEEGSSPIDGAVKGTQEVWGPVGASVMTTVCAFLPMMFMSGIIGKFVKQIPIAVVTALIISLLECYFILPHHIGRWVRVQQKRLDGPKRGLARLKEKISQGWDDFLVPSYLGVLRIMIKARYLVAVGTFGLLAAAIALALSPAMKIQLFPSEGIEIFFVKAEAPTGTNINITAELIRPIEEEIKKLPKNELKDFITRIGIHQQKFDDPNTRRGGEYAQVNVYLTPEPDRDRRAKEIIESLRQKIGTPEGLSRISFERVNPGPPVGKPISIGFQGKEYKDIMPAVEEVQEYVKTIKGVSDITNNYILGKEELQIRVDPSEAAAAGLSVATIGNSVRAAYEGIVATTIRKLDEEIDVRVLFPQEVRSQPNSLDEIFIPNPAGALVPLRRVANITHDQGISSYGHENNRREVRIFGEVDDKVVTATEVVSLVSKMVPKLRENHPKVQVVFGGEDEDTKEGMASLARAFIIAAFSIFLILVMTFKNVSQPLLVLLTIPLGIVAVILAFFVHGMPLSFFAMLGIVALAGVIVNNAIVLIDFINRDRMNGISKRESIYSAAKTRIRPIFLTTVTTVCGLLPTAYGLGGLDPFVVPVAMSLGWGIFFGSALATIVFPSAVAILDDIVDWWDKTFGKFFYCEDEEANRSSQGPQTLA